ncbi:hypothetical protein [Amycolatopsis sp. cmx-11-12]|uniref:hypothetical protein n=1 Tax=Amycolatopsis sp. cmx-11-12 TaxID=2785795 RepID=UPI003917509A
MTEPVELIEVIRLGDNELVAIWEAAEARTALTLVAALPKGELKRCFIPGWKILAHSATQFLFEISFCFRCDGALLRGPTVDPEQEIIHGFDSEDSTSRELLARLRAAAEA